MLSAPHYVADTRVGRSHTRVQPTEVRLAFDRARRADSSEVVVEHNQRSKLALPSALRGELTTDQTLQHACTYSVFRISTCDPPRTT